MKVQVVVAVDLAELCDIDLRGPEFLFEDLGKPQLPGPEPGSLTLRQLEQLANRTSGRENEPTQQPATPGVLTDKCSSWVISVRSGNG